MSGPPTDDRPDDRPDEEVVRAGVYRHWKGRYYLLLGLAHDADAGPPPDDREVVVYVGLYLDPTLPGPRMSVRTRASFFGPVDTAQGPMPRFAYVAATLAPGDLDGAEAAASE